EADVHEAGPGDMCERLAHSPLDAQAVDVAHREDESVELPEQLPLPFVERSDADECDAAGDEGREAPAVTAEVLACQPEARGEHHAVDVSTRARLGAVQVAVRVEPDDPAQAVGSVEAAEGPQRDRVIAAEHERDRTVAGALGDEVGDVAAGLLDLGQESS